MISFITKLTVYSTLEEKHTHIPIGVNLFLSSSNLLFSTARKPCQYLKVDFVVFNDVSEYSYLESKLPHTSHPSV